MAQYPPTTPRRTRRPHRAFRTQVFHGVRFYISLAPLNAIGLCFLYAFLICLVAALFTFILISKMQLGFGFCVRSLIVSEESYLFFCNLSYCTFFSPTKCKQVLPSSKLYFLGQNCHSFGLAQMQRSFVSQIQIRFFPNGELHLHFFGATKRNWVLWSTSLTAKA